MGLDAGESFLWGLKSENSSRAPIMNIVNCFGHFFPKCFGDIGAHNNTADAFEKRAVFLFVDSILMWRVPGINLSRIL